MLKITTLILALVVSCMATAQTNPDSLAKFQPEKIDMGKIKQGIPVTVYFQVTNISKQPIVFENIWGSCGCTVPDQIKEPLMPRQSTKVKVVYNAAALGFFNKSINIKLAGIPRAKIVQITGEVISAAEQAKQKSKS